MIPENINTKPVPFVSISCITYNHEPFIRDCLDGFLMQKTNFLFEVLIHDDASTDNTALIIREYEKLYPNIIKPMYQEKNQYSQGKRGIMARYNFPRARGKYIALCEGDDYWTDPLKLQKQVDFLEANEEFIACFHKCKIIDKYGNISLINHYTYQNKIEYTTIDIIKRHIIPTASLVFRNKIHEISEFLIDSKILSGDINLELHLSLFGKFYLINDEMSCYRDHPQGISKSKNNKRNAVEQYLYLFKKFNKFTNFEYSETITWKMNDILRQELNKVKAHKSYLNRFSLWRIRLQYIPISSFKEYREVLYIYLISKTYK